jgi:uncharacterized protein (TIGR02246 family)
LTEEVTMDREEDGVRALYQNLLDGWNQRRAERMAELLLDDAIVIGFDGSQMQGRRAVNDEMSRIFADHRPARYVGVIRAVTFLNPDVAVVHAVAGMVPPGKRAIKPENNAIQTLTTVKRDGRWRIALYQNTPARFDGRPQLAAELTAELEEALKVKAKAPGSQLFED